MTVSSSRGRASLSTRFADLHPAQSRSLAHSVRLIALKDLPHNKAYKDDVVQVKAGYARNYLVPQKYAVYATPQNFAKYGIVDPNVETAEQRQARLLRESSQSGKEDQYLKDADLLKKYLKDKTVRTAGYGRCCLWYTYQLDCFQEQYTSYLTDFLCSPTIRSSNCGGR